MNEFVKTFETLLGKYVYDVNKDEIVKITDDLYDYLRGNRKEIPLEGILLKEQGYLKEKYPLEIEHPMVDYFTYYIDRKIAKVTLQLTQNCNFRCSYCVYSEDNNEFQRSHSPERMTYNMAVKIIDFFGEHSMDSEAINIGFYGGEPLLEFSLIKKIVRYVEQRLLGKEVTYSITTNATLLTEEIVEYFIKNHIELMVSLDGSKITHNRNRVFAKDGEGSYDVVISNLNMVAEKYPSYFEKIHISMVIDPRYPYDQYAALFQENNNFRKLALRSSIVDDNYSVQRTIYSNDYLAQRDYQIFLALMSEFNIVSKQNISQIALQELQDVVHEKMKMNKRERIPERISHSGPCIPGQLRLFVNTNGDFYPCERVSENSYCMRIGNINDGFDYEKVRKILNICDITKEECKTCWNISHCGLCAKYADDGVELQKDLMLSNCRNAKNGTLRIFEYLALMNDIDDVLKVRNCNEK